MRIGVIIANYNYADRVSQAMASVMGQSYDCAEVVVIDDCSSDESWSVIENDPLFEQANIARLGQVRCGPAYARNFGIRTVYDRVDAFAFLDSDDTYEPGFLKAAVRVLQEDSHIGIAYANHRVTDEVQGITYVDYKEPFSLDAAQLRDIVGGNFVVAKHALAFAGPFNDQLPVCENYDFTRRVAQKFVPIHIPQTLVNTTITPRSLRASVPPDTWIAYRNSILTR